MDFNSRPREGGDKEISNARKEIKQISIHAPAKGATTKP